MFSFPPVGESTQGGTIMKHRFILQIIVILAIAYGCTSTRPESQGDRETLDRETSSAITQFRNKDLGMSGWFAEAYGYAVFPSVGKGGIGVGGAYGRGQVYRQGRQLGYATLKQVTVGFQLGGQAYSEIIFFKDMAALDEFIRGNYEFDAQASAVALTAGASVDAAYNGGVAIFTMTKGGLMYEASVGGQKFSYVTR